MLVADFSDEPRKIPAIARLGTCEEDVGPSISEDMAEDLGVARWLKPAMTL